ncbi:ornithine cyclodeaminase family protein [Aminobacter sp. SR38]|jgi:ornithine cyclodeaminase/alanine dehydrogenase-like protein (mu-crystallin family)|uniref:ornithine cyclodeaminase family protein n=1 Tax=Aminobacter sp. SR38 TaxID=2774562 RepID=UPI0017857CA3|nr:ornithine cyclodeaminase family protein [Aminobacter sp. SR38]QOF69503.1 ornithine cyclodeaminase family protein [Aminobacter sp. SR38]
MEINKTTGHHLSPRTTLVLTRSEVEGLVTQAEVIEAVEAAHADMSNGAAEQPAAVAMKLPSGTAAFLAMPALADRQGLAVVKLLADIPENSTRNLPMQRSMALLVSQETGAPIAIFHGQIPTRIRTASASAVATKHLSRVDSRVLGLVGAGELAIEHVRAIREIRPIERVVVWSRTAATIARFIERVEQSFPDLVLEGAASPQDVFAQSDIVCTLTPSRDAYVEGAWFRPGQHINAVGAPPRPDHREIDSAGMAKARVFLDSVPMAMHDSGDLLLAIADGAISLDQALPEIGDVITGKSSGRTSADDITLFNSTGLAIQDLAIGNLLVRRAREKGVGREIDFAA